MAVIEWVTGWWHAQVDVADRHAVFANGPSREIVVQAAGTMERAFDHPPFDSRATLPIRAVLPTTAADSEGICVERGRRQ